MTAQPEQPEQLLGMIVHKEFPDKSGRYTVFYRVSRSGRQCVLCERRLRRRCHVDHQVRSAIRRRRFRGLGHDLLPGSRVYHLIELPSISHTHNETFGIVRQMCSSLIKVPIQSSSHFSDMSIQSTNINSRTTPTASTATSTTVSRSTWLAQKVSHWAGCRHKECVVDLTESFDTKLPDQIKRSEGEGISPYTDLGTWLTKSGKSTSFPTSKWM